MRIWIYLGALLPMASPGAAAMMAPATLAALVERFAGQPARVDPRLLLPDCAAPDVDWAGNGNSVVVACAVPAWRVFVPVVGPVAGPVRGTASASGAPAIRRGDRVVVEAGGDGFVIGMEAVAEADSRDGRVNLRAAGGGRRLTGSIGADGRVRVHGLNAVVNGR